jgi:hypothetical protein
MSYLNRSKRNLPIRNAEESRWQIVLPRWSVPLTRIDIFPSLRWRWWQRLFFGNHALIRRFSSGPSGALDGFVAMSFTPTVCYFDWSFVVSDSIFCGVRSQRNLTRANKSALLAIASRAISAPLGKLTELRLNQERI